MGKNEICVESLYSLCILQLFSESFLTMFLLCRLTTILGSFPWNGNQGGRIR